MEELHIDSIDGGHEASYGLGHVPERGRTPTIYNLKIKAKDNYNITRSIKSAFYITNMTHYNVILGLT